MTKITIRYSLLACLALFTLVASSQEVFKRKIEWKGIQTFQITDDSRIYQLYFENASYTTSDPAIPVYSEKVPLTSSSSTISASVRNAVYENLSNNETKNIDGMNKIGSTIVPIVKIGLENKRAFAFISFTPLVKNSSNGIIQKLVSFDLVLQEKFSANRLLTPKAVFKNNSVLSAGNWYKIAVSNSGVQKLSYSDLANIGIPVATVDPRNIRIYGNGGGMLPEHVFAPRYDDLMENAIQVIGESDGKFDQNDYVLFYGESPDVWEYNNSDDHFHHKKNIYSNYTYYFITTDLGPGKRILEQSSSTVSPTNTVSSFTDHAFHELDDLNIVKTGRQWFDSPAFDFNTSFDYDFSFPNIDVSKEVYMKISVAARSFTSSNMKFYQNGSLVLTATLSNVSGTQYSDYATTSVKSTSFNVSSSSINIRADYNKTSNGAVAWLDYIELNAIRYLSFVSPQLSFRNPNSSGPGNITEFNLGNASSAIQIWNVTDPINVKRLQTSLSGNNLTFRIPNDSLQEFISFNGTGFFTPVFIKQVANQNLHSLNPYDLIIITHPSFANEAYRLASFHNSADGLSVFVIEPEKIYNEFSSGAQDITGIRDFMKMFYDKHTGNNPLYLLLFGDASYDYKDRIAGNTNFVPTWEDQKSMNIISSIATDDYFGFMDDIEGPQYAQLLDIGIGRLPVATIEQARLAVDKIINYSSNKPEVMGNWRNMICFVADDEDGDLHLEQAERLAAKMDTMHQSYNIDKIYVDAYPQVSTPGGQRAPEVNTAINRRVDQGAILMNYTGHGGEVGWGHERFLEISDINSWTNYDKLSVFVTATCEFSRYDDPERISAGEIAFLNPNGGAIGMFTTARATYGSSNFNLNNALFDCAFDKVINGNYPRFGDIIRLSKNKDGDVGDNDRKFILLGDPVLRLSYPEYQVNTININGSVTASDTLKALKKVTVSGEVQDENGVKLSSFNGILYPVVFDKPRKIRTLGTDPSSSQITFDIQNSILYKGKASILNGEFSFTFIVPKDIAYNFGFGKISYYASTTNTDAAGFDKRIIVGGYESGITPDNEGPVIDLYMNDESFVFGGLTDQNPTLLAFVTDSSGVNTVGNGIGHDIVAVMDRDHDKSINLNEYYEADLNSYTSGTVKYPYTELQDGNHTLSLKVWDVHNNSAETYLEFVVAESAELALDHVLNYPNPFTTHTEFFFEHNQPNTNLEVLLQIFTVSGRLVYTYNDYISSSGFRVGPIPPFGWDGKDDFGDRLARGVYLYKLSVKSMDGSYADKLEKLVILK